MVFYNIHIDDFLAEPLHFKILKRRPLRKYGFLIEEYIRRNGKLVILADSSVIPDGVFFLFPGFIRKIWLKIEMGYWTKRNNLQGKVEIHYTTAKLNRSEPLFFFAYKTTIGSFGKRIGNIEYFESKVVHLSHYFVATSLKSANLKKLSNLWLAGDTDISANSYFTHFFNWYQKPILLLYFTIAPRFSAIKPVSERANECVATGTFHNLKEERPGWKYEDFINFFGSTTYHPVRKKIFENKEKWAEWINANVSFYRAGSNGGVLKFLNHFFVSQKKYFSIDIVQLYNNYKYAVVGEELSGFPALGAFEAIACGCVLFAQPDYYKGLPITEGIHYIPYNGDPAAICEILRSGIYDDSTLAEISENARKVVSQHFTSSAIVDLFQDQMTKLIVTAKRTNE